MVAWESTLERDLVLHLEMSPGVLRYHEQPVKIYYEDDGELRLYIPDFEVVLEDGEVIHMEVKPSRKLAQPDLARKYTKIRRYYADMDMGYRILTEKDIRVEPRLSSLQTLSQYLLRFDGENLKPHLDSLRLLPAKTVAGAAAVCGSEQDVYRLIAMGYVLFDLSRPLSGHSAIQLLDKEAGNVPLYV